MDPPVRPRVGRWSRRVTAGRDGWPPLGLTVQTESGVQADSSPHMPLTSTTAVESAQIFAASPSLVPQIVRRRSRDARRGCVRARRRAHPDPRASNARRHSRRAHARPCRQRDARDRGQEHSPGCDRWAECCVKGSCGSSNASPSFADSCTGHVARGADSCAREQCTGGKRALVSGRWVCRLLSCLCRPVVAVRAPHHRRGPRLPSRALRRRVVRSSFRGSRRNTY